MPTKISAAERPHLLVLFIFLVWITNVFAASDPTKGMGSNAVRLDWDSTGLRRNLRSYSWEMVHEENDDGTEERGLKKITSSAKKFVENLKLNYKQPIKRWSASVATTFKKQSELAEQAMVSTMTRRFGDKAVARMIDTATEVTDVTATSRLASKLGEAQQAIWLKEGKTADDVFKLLKLNLEGNVLASPLLETWSSYVMMKLKQRSHDTLFTVLKTQYNNDDEALAKMIALAKKDFSTSVRAGILDEVQFYNWVRARMTADDVFRMLQTGSGGRSFWQSAVEHLEFLRVWKDEGKTADDVLKLLKLHQVEDNLRDSPMFNTWKLYVSKLGKDPDEALLAVLKKLAP
ncbi:unnamed protein product [Phytophthora lilii]|uniref:Unnamed protein product n=1 Tax=Phytophthora lilii TaxID=2077276 RepID=A0A9W6WR80_9STRA|nr:unnamed protein product [Phytophthora lilii]